MGEEQQFCLRWNNFQTNITSQFEALRNEEEFVDVTLACDGQRLKAHKVVLSACSPYFKELFTSNPCKHPILFLRDVEFCHLRSLVEFMYAGEVNVAQAQLSAFLRTAESLQIRGLTEAPQHHKEEQLSPTQDSVQSSSGSKKASSVGRLSLEEEDDDILSVSPPLSPSPAKRTCYKQPLQPPLLPQKHEVDAYQDESPEIIEPKIEVPDYSSDGECKMDGGAMSGSMFGLDTPIDGNNSLSSLHGAMDMLPGTSSQNFMTDFSQDSAQADLRKLHSLDPRPCPICFRMYSNLSNLRQHVRLIHNPQTVACPLCSKPFKTKLYLKRHLMSFHELACSPAQASGHPSHDFFPPPPQVVMGSDGPKVKDVPEYFHNSRMPNQYPFSFPGDDRPYPNGHRNDMKFPNLQMLMDDRSNSALMRNFNKSTYLSQLLNKSGDNNMLNVINSGMFKNPETMLPSSNPSVTTNSSDTFPYMSIASTRNPSEGTFSSPLDRNQEKQQYGAPSFSCKTEESTHYQLSESTRGTNAVSCVENNVQHSDSKIQGLSVNSFNVQDDANDTLLALSENKREDANNFLTPNLLESTPNECSANGQAMGN